MGYEKRFHWADYLVFACSLAISIIVGIIVAIKDRWHKQSSESYLMGDRRMNWILVGLSFWATVVDAVFFVGLTTDFYYFGMTAVWVALARFPAGAFVTLIVIPKFYRLSFRITSAYEYFEHRFNLAVRMAVGVIFIILKLLMMAAILYTPSLVLAAVSELTIYWSIAIGAAVCVFYTALGGMKTVIWVDSIQILIMVTGMVVLAAKGVVMAGGMDTVWKYYAEVGQRDDWNDLSPDPWNRHTLWNTLFLFAIIYCGMFGVNQTVLQRYMAVNDMRQSQWSVILGLVLGVGFNAIVMICAMAAFAHVGGDEPMLNIPDQRRDQILPYFVMHLLGDYHGIPGLVVASLFAAALSLSSGQNALAAIITKDFIQPIYKRTAHKDLSQGQIGTVARVTAVIVGVLTFALSMAVPQVNDTILSMALSMLSFIIGPILGLLIAGFFCFWVEHWGALFGLICSLGWGLMMYFGAVFHSNKIGMDSKPWFNSNFTAVKKFTDPHVTPVLFDVSYTWYVFLDVMVVLVVSSVISIIVHCARHKGKLSLSDIMPPRDLRYTVDDFKAAISCNSTIKQDAPLIPEEDYKDTLPHTYTLNGVENKGILDDSNVLGVSNAAFECTHL